MTEGTNYQIEQLCLIPVIALKVGPLLFYLFIFFNSLPKCISKVVIEVAAR